MIYTVTFNPALDYVVKVNQFALGVVNRSFHEEVYCGGKGLNVSEILWNLGIESTALGFIAGFTGDEILRRVGEKGFRADFIRVEHGMSRINVKLKSDGETEINGTGPLIGECELTVLFDKLRGLAAGDHLVLSGSIPSSVGEDVYERIMAMLDGKDVKITVDAEKKLLLNVLRYHPFLIKPNNHELGAMFGRELRGDGEIIGCARELQGRGAGNVLVSMAKDGAILVTDSGEIYQIDAPDGEVKNSVGAGDSMVAGFLAGYMESGDYLKALKMGSAAGSASAFSEGLAKKEEILKLYSQL